MKPNRLARARSLFRPPAPGAGDASPIWLPGDERAVLCLHGLTGTPFEVRPLAETLAARGFSVAAPVLAGHGSSAAALAETGFADWLDSARRAAERLHAHTGTRACAIAGFSMGGLLALRLAAEWTADVKAIAVLATPIRMRRWQTSGIRLLAALPRMARRGPLANIPKTVGSDVVDEEVRRQVPSLTVMPVPALANLLGLMDSVRPDLPSIEAPALVAHGLRDHTIPFEDSLEIAGSLGSDTVERMWLQRSGHLVCVDVEKRELAGAVTRFFERHLPRAQAVPG